MYESVSVAWLGVSADALCHEKPQILHFALEPPSLVIRPAVELPEPDRRIAGPWAARGKARVGSIRKNDSMRDDVIASLLRVLRVARAGRVT